MVISVENTVLRYVELEARDATRAGWRQVQPIDQFYQC